MKYSILILTLLLIVGIGTSANLSVYADYYATANTTYDWTLFKNANRTDLDFAQPPDPEPELVLFTIDITRSAPYAQTLLIGNIRITNVGTDTAFITSVVDSIRYWDFQHGLWIFINEAILFTGSHSLAPGATWIIPMNIPFTTPYPLDFAFHYNFVNVYTFDGGRFQYYDAFHATPTVVNETLHVWDEITVPVEFNYTWDYNGPWKALDDTTFLINLSLTNQSATSGTYVVRNYAYGINECGLWMDSVLVHLRVKPPDSFPGRGFTPGYWKNHPEDFAAWLPVTIATVTVTTVPQAVDILSTNNPTWPRFLKFFLAMKFNCLNDPSMLSSYYNDMTKTGEFMENQTVAYILSVADGYTPSTPNSALNAMKNIFEQICNNDGVLWLTPQGSSGKSFSLSTTSSITLIPNPFDNVTEIRFLTEVKEPVALTVYDISGAKVRDLVKNANTNLYWDGTDNNGRKLTRGVYIIRVNNLTLKALISR
ncbi:MAG: T9SS type A sorting domain-containing protein [candidate division WOR-3 bacterium]|nr:T9SS type A sorting domain-containing protein [candidate division WOR-3 bacterium]MDH5684843.1 T9SS type A sorting domain-containing protein [candidate division WOR-3 bacterium]